MSFQFSRKFYIAQWFRDTTLETEKAMKSQKMKNHLTQHIMQKNLRQLGRSCIALRTGKSFFEALSKPHLLSSAH